MLLDKLDRNDPGGEWSTSDDDTSAFSLNSISILCCEGEMLVNKLISDGRMEFHTALLFISQACQARSLHDFEGPTEDDAWYVLHCYMMDSNVHVRS